MNLKKTIDYIQILFWVCILVAGATGTYTYFAWGYIDWVVVGQTIIVFINTFLWVVLIREKFKIKTHILGAYISLLFPILIMLMYLNEDLQGWNTGIDMIERDVMFTLIFIFVFISSIIKMRYGILSALSFSLIFFIMDRYYSFQILEYGKIFLSLILTSVTALSVKFIAEKFIFRRWSDMLPVDNNKGYSDENFPKPMGM